MIILITATCLAVNAFPMLQKDLGKTFEPCLRSGNGCIINNSCNYVPEGYRCELVDIQIQLHKDTILTARKCELRCGAKGTKGSCTNTVNVLKKSTLKKIVCP